MKERVRPFVLQNMYDFGSVNPKAVLGLVLRSNPELKKNVPKVLKEIETQAQKVATLSKEQIKKELEKYPELRIKKKEEVKGPLKPLKNAIKGKVVVRIAPSPSGALHIGHAYGASLNYEYAKMYDGKLILRIEDTNPENIYPKAYELIEQDTKWLTDNNVDKVVIQSDRLGLYYDAAEKLVQKEKAYVCECDADAFRELKGKGKACPCRSLDKKEHNTRYQKMFSSYRPGQAVLRLKTDIKHKNPAMRDFAIMRINDHVHPRTKDEHRVWPLMVFSVAIDDHDLGITHVLNGKDHADNAKKEAIIMKYLGWKVPEYQHWGRINFKGLTLSTSKTKLLIEQNEFHGWDDIRLPFLPALRKRGYQAGAFRKFAMEIGLSLNDKTVTQKEFWKMVNAFDKDIIDREANRYFAVFNPTTISIENAPTSKVELDLHPDYPNRGKRVLNAKTDFYIATEDFEKLEKGKIHRLIDHINFEKKGEALVFISQEYEDYKNAKNKGKIIHWIPVSKSLAKVEMTNTDNTIMKGYGEKGLKEVEGIIQLERVAFCSITNKKKNKIEMYYLHT